MRQLKMWLIGRKMCKGVETTSAKALRQECAGDIRGTARRPLGLEQREQGGVGGWGQRAWSGRVQIMTWTCHFYVHNRVITGIKQDTQCEEPQAGTQQVLSKCPLCSLLSWVLQALLPTFKTILEQFCLLVAALMWLRDQVWCFSRLESSGPFPCLQAEGCRVPRRDLK